MRLAAAAIGPCCCYWHIRRYSYFGVYYTRLLYYHQCAVEMGNEIDVLRLVAESAPVMSVLGGGDL